MLNNIFKIQSILNKNNRIIFGNNSSYFWKGKKGNSTVIGGDFNMLLLASDKLTRQRS